MNSASEIVQGSAKVPAHIRRAGIISFVHNLSTISIEGRSCIRKHCLPPLPSVFVENTCPSLLTFAFFKMSSPLLICGSKRINVRFK